MQTQLNAKSKKRASASLVGVDIGFGEVKYLSNFSSIASAFPSAVVAGAKPSASKLFDLDEITESALIVTTEDGTFFVGEQAMNVPTSGSKRTQVRDRATDVTSRVLFQTAIALSVPHEAGAHDVHLVTGLPNDDYDLSIKRHLQEFLEKPFEVTFHLSESRSVTKKITIKTLEILRQPEGTITFDQFIFDQETFIAPSNKAHTMVGVIDFGHFTTDYALFQEGVIIESDSVNGSTVGVTEVYNKLRKKLVIKFDEMGFEFRATDKDLDEAVRTGSIHYMGRKHDVQEEVQAAAAEVASSIAKAVLDAWGNETNRLELINITGGGANVFSELLTQEFEKRKKQGFQVVDAPQFSNVIGYFMYGCISLTDIMDESEVMGEYINPVFMGGN